jgi:hypothetical protein
MMIPHPFNSARPHKVHASRFKHSATGSTSFNQMRGLLLALTLAVLATAAIGGVIPSVPAGPPLRIQSMRAIQSSATV